MKKLIVPDRAVAGFSLVELLAVVAILVIVGAFSIPHLKAYSVEAHLVGASRIFQGEFRKARSTAIARGVQTAIRFEDHGGRWMFSTYIDGNHNGVLSADIQRGIDALISGPIPVSARATHVRLAINPGVPVIPPGSGLLSGDPIRFGNSNMVSFSPLGTATPGTFYLAGEGLQGAVRVVAGSARVRFLVCRGKTWVEK
jgi:prepilin-type N-terminal cleavage/methylation domain-containing protein